MDKIAQAQESRSARIESLRALAALAVLLGHAYGVTTGFSLDSFADRLGLAGGFGVWIFFALTGYLLFWPFVRRDYGDGGPIDLRRYALNRVLRILPLYYTVLIVLLLIQEGGGSTEQWIRFTTFTQSFFDDTVATVDPPMWSLVVEIMFYALLPLLAWGLARASRRDPRKAAALLLALGGASFAVWLVKVQGQNDLTWRLSLAATFFNFVPGMLLALARARLPARERPLRLPSSTVLMLASVPVWLLAAAELRWAQPLCALGSTLVLAAIVLPAREGVLVRSLGWRPLAALGVASYSLYLWHVPLLDLVEHEITDGPLLIPLGLAASIAVAAASYAVIERPFLSLRGRWGSTAAVHGPAPAARPTGI